LPAHGPKEKTEYETMTGNAVRLRINIKKYVILFLVFEIAAVLLPFSSNAFSGNPLSAAGFLDFQVKKDAPDFILNDLKDKPTRLRAFRGKVVLLYFWTTW
jgi:cytochrome oxidase Cu insertion factor (SCO1/SenC/PrrC family)